MGNHGAQDPYKVIPLSGPSPGEKNAFEAARTGTKSNGSDAPVRQRGHFDRWLYVLTGGIRVSNSAIGEGQSKLTPRCVTGGGV
jgi:hypothetical protein